uniref:Putative pentalaris n=1 Tax=Rhipicephalus pulchellus TaxID=72859 RepID=L7LT82_RHIPC
MNICRALQILFFIVIGTSSGKGFDDFFISDARCTIPPRNSSHKCHPQGWFFDKHTRLCVPSCGRGAFTTEFECMGACRSVEACGLPMESSLCLLNVFAVYAYDPIAKGCFMTYDCSLFGNKFPTARECRRTCEGGRFEAIAQKINYDSLLAAGQQRLIGAPGLSQSQMQIGGPGAVGFPQFPTGPVQLPGSTQISGSNESLNTSLQQASSSQQSSTMTVTGTTISSTENGQLQGGQTSIGTQSTSTRGSGASQVLGSQSSNAGGAVASQTTNGHGQATGSIQVSGSQGALSPSSEQQTGSSQSAQGTGNGATHGSIQSGVQQQEGQTATGTQVSIATGSSSGGQVSSSQPSAGGVIVTQATNAAGQQESQKPTGIVPEGSSQTGNLGPSGGQRKPRPELKLPTIKVSKLRPPPIDKDCKVTLPHEPTRGCRRRRWYYDSKKKACRPSCSKKAPFYNKIACDGVCRSLEACDFPMASIPCFFRKVHVVYIYNQWRKKCMKGYDCSYFGNKFPTLRECQQTCKMYEALRHVKNTTESSSQVSTTREKIISTMTQQQKVNHSTVSPVQGSLNSQGSHGQESMTGRESSNAQSSQSGGRSGAQQNLQTISGIQITGTGQGPASSTSSSSQVAGQISRLDSTGSEQGGQAAAGTAGGSGLTGNQRITGGAQQDIQTSTTSSSQQSSQLINSQTTSSQQTSQSHAGSSTVPEIQTNEIGTGGGQQNTISATTGHSQSSIHTNNNGLIESGQSGSSASGSSSHSGIVGQPVVIGGQQHQTTASGASNTQISSQITGSGTSQSQETGPSSSGVSVSSSTHGQLQGTEGTTSSSSQGQQQHIGGTTSSSSQGLKEEIGSSQHHMQNAAGSSSQVTVQVSGPDMGGVQQSTSSIGNDVTSTHISTTPGHGNNGACQAPLRTAYCLFDVYAMYAYDPFSGSCFMLYDCSLHGNKFPSLKACKQACVRRVRYPRLGPSEQQIILNLTSQSQSAVTGTIIPQLPAGVPPLPGSTQVSLSQGKMNTSTQQAISSQSALIISQGTAGHQSLTGPTEAGKQVSGEGQISAGQVTTQQSTIGGGVAVTHGQTAQEKHEMDKAAAMDEEWFNQQGKASTLEEQQKILKKMKLRSVKVSKPKPSSLDKKCSFKPRTPKTQGCRQRWYYNSETKECHPTCSKKAPFSNKIACDGDCRSLEACDFPMASLFCFFRRAHEVYIYNQNTKQCFKGYDCSNFGNKFPTLAECQNTCRLYEEKQANISAIQRKKIKNNANNEQSVLQSSTSSAQGAPGAQVDSALPKPVQATAGGNGDLPAPVPSIQTETNHLPTSGNSNSQGQAAVTVKTGKK